MVGILHFGPIIEILFFQSDLIMEWMLPLSHIGIYYFKKSFSYLIKIV